MDFGTHPRRQTHLARLTGFGSGGGVPLLALFWLLSGAVLLTGCASPPPPWMQKSNSAQSSYQGPTPPAVIVQRGDTVYALSRRYGIPVKAIIQTNRLTPPYVLHVGDRLVLPRPRVYVVQRGDTLYGIAKTYDVDMGALAGLNQIQPPYRIWVGQRLALPSRAEEAPQPVSPPPVVVQRTPTTPPTSRIEETSLRPPPPASSSSTTSGIVATSQGSVQSGAQTTASSSATSSLPASQDSTTSGIAPPPQKPQQRASLAVAPQSKPVVRATKPPQPPARAGKTFVWPVQGRVIGQYGPSAGGTRNDGINIAVLKGASVHAAENGVVVYAGNELKGFGNLLLVKHSGGWMTAYGHNETLLVKRGDTVRRGQIIAKAGQTGNVDSPQLHFEVRKDSNPVDPMKYLDRSVAGG